LTAASQLGPTFDEPIYLQRGLEGWRDFSHFHLLQLGTMPLPADVQTLPLYLLERFTGKTLDPVNDLQNILVWMRSANLLFWWLLLWYGGKAARMLAGPWAGRLAVALLACEPNLLAHAALATTDIAVTACLLALLYHFRAGRDSGWFKRLAIPAVWFGLAILAKASAVVYGPICLVTIELERLIRSGALTLPLSYFWRQSRTARQDLKWIGLGGLALAVVYCGSDFRPCPSFQEWAAGLPNSALSGTLVWFADHLCIFSNAFEGIVRQIRHNLHGHGAYLLGASHPRSLWYYFPVLLTIKLALPVLLGPLAVALARIRALSNWACWTALALLGFSLSFRVQIGIRLVLPLVGIALVGLSAALAQAFRSARWQWTRPVLACSCGAGLFWMALSSATVWPHGLCYVNELWGGTERGYELVSDSNYDWGQGLPELLAWQQQNEATMDVWYFGQDQKRIVPPLRYLPFEQHKVDGPDDVLSLLQGQYLAASTTMVYGNPMRPAHREAAAFLRGCKPTARTTTFLIFERQALLDACQKYAHVTLIPGDKAR
jgi:hypothetical protein